MRVEFHMDKVKLSEDLERVLPQKIRAAVSRTANDVLATAKKLTPRASGKLLAGWERSPMRVNKYGGSVTVSNKEKHAKTIEGGHSDKAPDGMLNPALKKHRKAHTARIEIVVQEAMDSL